MEHAGFLMALGLNGHLKNLAVMNMYEYLIQFREMTSVGLLLGKHYFEMCLQVNFKFQMIKLCRISSNKTRNNGHIYNKNVEYSHRSTVAANLHGTRYPAEHPGGGPTGHRASVRGVRTPSHDRGALVGDRPAARPRNGEQRRSRVLLAGGRPGARPRHLEAGRPPVRLRGPRRARHAALLHGRRQQAPADRLAEGQVQGGVVSNPGGFDRQFGCDRAGGHARSWPHVLGQRQQGDR